MFEVTTPLFREAEEEEAARAARFYAVDETRQSRTRRDCKKSPYSTLINETNLVCQCRNEDAMHTGERPHTWTQMCKFISNRFLLFLQNVPISGGDGAMRNGRKSTITLI